MHKIGTKHGVLNQHFTATILIPCVEKFLAVENVPPNKLISVREAARLSSMGTGNDSPSEDVEASVTPIDALAKANVKCNSKCHGKKTCGNQQK
jgi:hypothetical protein